MRNPYFRNIDFIRDNAPNFLSNLGYVKIGYEGADASLIFGGYAWFQAERSGSPFVYTIQMRKQGTTLKYTYERILNPESASNTVRVQE